MKFLRPTGRRSQRFMVQRLLVTATEQHDASAWGTRNNCCLPDECVKESLASPYPSAINFAERAAYLGMRASPVSRGIPHRATCGSASACGRFGAALVAIDGWNSSLRPYTDTNSATEPPAILMTTDLARFFTHRINR
jgi:hypothetical protein